MSRTRRVVVTQRHFDAAARDYLEANECEVVLADLPEGQADGGLSHADLVARLDGAAGWIVGHAHVTRPLLADLPALQVIARRGVGYERVDLGAAADLGRVVTIAAGGNEDSVADHAVGMMLALARRFREQQAAMEAGDWAILRGGDLNGKVVGIVGLGRIGRCVARRLSGFGVRLLALASGDAPAVPGVERVGRDDLLAAADVVSLHAPLTASTRHFIDAAALRRMKPTSLLLNTARGGLVDDTALLVALEAGEIAGAGLDVFESEADPAMLPVSRALVALPNVVATPHAAASSAEGLARTNMIASRTIVDVLRGRSPPEHCVVADGRPRPVP